MPLRVRSWRIALCLLLALCAAVAAAARPAAPPQLAPQQALQPTVALTVVDENGVAVPDAVVTSLAPEGGSSQLRTDYAGHCTLTPQSGATYRIRVEKPGFYQAESNLEAGATAARIVLTHEQIVLEQVNVNASVPGIDPEQTANKSTMTTEEIVNLPYPTSRDIRNLLPFNPGVVRAPGGQVHIAGSESWETLDLIDGFDARSPVNGTLDVRVSGDAVRAVETESTRYPVEFGRATGGIVAYTTGMGDNKLRFNATNFLPSFRDVNGPRLDKIAPRLTFSGPLVRDRVWFFDGLEGEYDNIYVSGLPAGANTDHLARGSELIKTQANLTSANILTVGLLFNDSHSPYDGISTLVPQQSTIDRNTIVWLPYLRDHWSVGGALLDIGVAVAHFRDGYQPHGDTPYQITPETTQGSYFENLKGSSQREQATATLYLPPKQWFGQHSVKLGIEGDHIGYDETVTRAPITYLSEAGTVVRQSVFPQVSPFSQYNVDVGGYIQDRWQAHPGLLLEPGLRLDWDEIIRQPLLSPRLAATYSPPGSESKLKLSGGVGLYYEHTQLEYLTRSQAGVRFDTYYAANGITPTSPAQETEFTANDSTLHDARTLNWSLGAESELTGSILLGANFLQKRTSDGFTYSNASGALTSSGDYVLTNQRQDHYNSVEIDARRIFAGGYTLFASYTRSSARTNAVLDYRPTPSPLGAQQSGPLPWDTPNRLLSWGWLPLRLPKGRVLPDLKKNWDFVYTLEWHTGFAYTTVNAVQQVVGLADSQRFPDYLSFSPGLEWRFHIHGAYFGLRGVLENATNSQNPSTVNNNVDSPEYGAFTNPMGRALTARIRLIGAK
jgi:hypothetical protein